MTPHIPYIDAARIDAAMSLTECIELMQQTLIGLEDGGAIQPLRTVIHLPAGGGSLYTMPAFTAAPRGLVVKMITIFHGNDAKGMPSHQGLVVVFDAETGTPRALLDAARLTALRTAAVTAVATRALARADAATLAILGAGVQARPHVEALRAVRPFRTVRIWSRTRERAAALALSVPHGSAAVYDVATAREAVEGADVICTVTTSATPVLEGGWLVPGVHINAVGASTPQTRELDSDAVARARIFVDSLESARNEAGDLLIPLREGRIAGPDQWTALGAVLNGQRPGRQSAAEITVFKSLGLAAEDAAAASVIATRATVTVPL